MRLFTKGITQALVLLLLVLFLPDAAKAGPVRVEGSSEHVLRIPASGEKIRILVWQPSLAPPAEGFPVLYAFDGDRNFGLFSDNGRALEFRAKRTGRYPAVVVGIGYPAGEYSLKRRNYDLTPPAAEYEMPPRPNGLPWPEMGGGDDFLDAVEQVIKPFVRAHYPVNAGREALFGHSFGGMMVLHALFNRSDSYDTYIAASPSIWFNGKAILGDARTFLERPGSADQKPLNLLMMVGGNEQTIAAWEKADGKQLEQREKWLAYNRMVDNARDLAALIRRKENSGIDLEFEIVGGEGHGSVVPIAVYRGLWYAIRH